MFEACVTEPGINVGSFWFEFLGSLIDNLAVMLNHIECSKNILGHKLKNPVQLYSLVYWTNWERP